MKKLPFRDRGHLGELLADKVIERYWDEPVVLALANEGVPVATHIADLLDAPLDLMLVRPVDVPGYDGPAVGAVAESDPPLQVVDEDARRIRRIDDAVLEQEFGRAEREITESRLRYRGGRDRVALTGRTVILIASGIESRTLARAALLAARRERAARVVLAVGVASRSDLDALADALDEAVCLHVTESPCIVSIHFDDFPPVSDRTVIELLDVFAVTL